VTGKIACQAENIYDLNFTKKSFPMPTLKDFFNGCTELAGMDIPFYNARAHDQKHNTGARLFRFVYLLHSLRNG
jgi:hypothetical protein